jgi:hypothetical protein
MDNNQDIINSNLIQATIFEDTKIIEKLIKHDGDITQGALYQALYFNDIDTLNFLLETDKKYYNYFSDKNNSPLTTLLEPLAKHDNMEALILLDKYGLKEKLENFGRNKGQLFLQTFIYFSSNTLGYLLEHFNIQKDYYSLEPVILGFESFVHNKSHEHNFYQRKFDEAKYHQFLQTMHDYNPDVFQQLMLSAIGNQIGTIFNTHSYDAEYLKGFFLFGLEPLKKLKDYSIKQLPDFDYQKLLIERFEKQDATFIDLFKGPTETIEKIFLDMSLNEQSAKKGKMLKI